MRHHALEERKGTKCVSNAQWSWSGRGFELIIGTTLRPGRSRAGPGLLISWVILTSSWHRRFPNFGVNLTPNLAPKLGPKSIKNRSKSFPSCIPNCILFLIAF